MSEIAGTPEVKRLYRYERNSKSYVSDAPMFYFEWYYEGGLTLFGFHGTQAEYDAKGVMHKYESDCPAEWVDARVLMKKEPMKEID